MEREPVRVMKRVLIISPHFPPVNAADMHRVRQSLPYFREFGWEPVVITVDEPHVESYSRDPLLLHTIPEDIEIHKVKAWDVGRTRKFGLGSLSMRSYIHFKRKGDELLQRGGFDLVYFSTTAFHVMALGPRWKRKFGIPFVLDIQDPWRNDFYLDKPRKERPPKFFISYNIDKWLERKTVPHADGIISVSRGYVDVFLKRYPMMREEQFRVITFGASYHDFAVMEEYVKDVRIANLDNGKINIVYVGRGGHDMRFALEIVFKALARGMKEKPELFSRLHLWFIGTSYAPPGQGQKTIQPVAQALGVGENVTEITDRIPYFDTLFLLKKADTLLVPGSTDTSYTASKIYPYILAEKPLLAVFYKESSVVEVLTTVKYGQLVTFDHLAGKTDDYVGACMEAFTRILNSKQGLLALDKTAFDPYSAKRKTLDQVELFNAVVRRFTDKR